MEYQVLVLYKGTGIEGVLEKREINKRDDLRMLKIQMENIKDYEKE